MAKALRMNADEIGKRVYALRTKLGISQRALHAPGVSYAHVSRIECGDRHPSISTLIVLAEKLGTTALYLMTGDENAHCPVCGRDGHPPESD